MLRVSITVVLGLVLCGCGGDDGGGGASTTATTQPGPTSTAADDGGDSTTDANATTEPGTGGGGDSTTSSAGGSSSDDAGELSGFLDSDGPMCSTDVHGEWNACIDENGAVQTTLCNYLGDSDANGFIGCLTSAEMEGANTCFINGCVDVCDCFPPPATGNAPVVCDAILEGGGMGCALDCSGGETCPDGMQCLGSTCFWPPAG